MSTIKYWNFRVVETQEGGIAFIEAYYDKKDRIIAWMDASADFYKKDRKALRKALKRPIIKVADLPGSDDPWVSPILDADGNASELTDLS